MSPAFVVALELFLRELGVPGEATLAELVSGAPDVVPQAASIDYLTAHTGRSLVQSCAVLSARSPAGLSPLFGRPTCLVAYADEYSCVADLLSAAHTGLGKGRGYGAPSLLPVGACAWIEAFCGPSAPVADVVDEVLLYASPLVGEWLRPADPPLEPSIPAPEGATEGPAVLSRALCVLEVARALAAGLPVHVQVSTEETEDLMTILETELPRVDAAIAAASADGLQLPASFASSASSASSASAADVADVASQLAEVGGSIEGALRLVQNALRSWLASEAAVVVRMLETSRGMRAPLQLRCDLSALLSALGRPAEAEALLVHEATLREEALGSRHADTLATVSTLARQMAQEERTQEAISLYRHVVREYEASLGNHSPVTLRSMVSLGELLAAERLSDEAATVYRNALKGLEITLGTVHPLTLQTTDALGMVLAEQGKRGLAASIFKRALEGYQKAYGPRHPETLGTMSNLANALRLQGKLEPAVTLYHQAYNGLHTQLGANDRETLRAMHGLAAVLAQLRRHEEAVPLYRQAYAGRCELLGTLSPITLRTLGELAQSLVALGELDEGQELLRTCLAGCNETYGPEHDEALQTAERLAVALVRGGDHAVAEGHYQHVLGVLAATLGDKHERTRAVASKLVDNLISQARLSDAQDIAKHYRLDWALRQVRKPPGVADSALKGLNPLSPGNGRASATSVPAGKGQAIESVVKERTRAALAAKAR